MAETLEAINAVRRDLVHDPRETVGHVRGLFVLGKGCLEFVHHAKDLEDVRVHNIFEGPHLCDGLNMGGSNTVIEVVTVYHSLTI